MRDLIFVNRTTTKSVLTDLIIKTIGCWSLLYIDLGH